MLTRNVSGYWKVVTTSAREDSANAKRLITALILSSVRLALIAAIYKVAYRSGGNTSLSYANAVWSISVYFAFILGLGLRNVYRLIDNEVRTGTVEVGLIKPLDWRLVKVCQLVGKNALEFLLLLVVLPIVLLVMVGPPNIAHISLPMLVIFGVMTIFAMITASAIFMMVGLSAFWLNDSHPVFGIVDKLIMVFGGAFVPIALLPDAVQTVVRYSPMGVYAAPTQLFNPAISSSLIHTLLSAIVWSGVLLWLCRVMWLRVERRIEVNGG